MDVVKVDKHRIALAVQNCRLSTVFRPKHVIILQHVVLIPSDFHFHYSALSWLNQLKLVLNFGLDVCWSSDLLNMRRKKWRHFQTQSDLPGCTLHTHEHTPSLWSALWRDAEVDYQGDSLLPVSSLLIYHLMTMEPHWPTWRRSEAPIASVRFQSSSKWKQKVFVCLMWQNF